VFVVGYLGDWRRAAAVLFEPESLRGNPAPSRKAGQKFAADFVPSVAGSLDTECGGGKLTHQSVANGHLIGTITARMFNALGARDVEEGAVLAVAQPAYALQGAGHASQNSQGSGWNEEVSFTLNRLDVHGVAQPIGLDEEQNAMVDAFGTLKARTAGGGFEGSVMQSNMAVRRLTPIECERLQGFPDGYTNIPWRKAIDSPDGPRYKALGNSMAVPVMKWIGERIKLQMPTPAG
jgi:DNA (cytosine-5)-methyltransferase 1